MINRELGNYTIVLNSVINNKNLSAKAKGVYVYLQSKADDWQFYESEIVENFTDGKASIRSALKELQKEQLLLKYQKPSKKKGFNKSTWVLNPTSEDIALYCEVSNADRFYADINNADINNADIKSSTNKTNYNKTNNNNTNSTVKREKNFKKFREHFIQNYRTPFSTKGIGFLEDALFEISAAGLVINKTNGKIMESEEAYKVWDYLYQEQGKIN